jgi:exo-1,4-beta-D-glucosaminidase
MRSLQYTGARLLLCFTISILTCTLAEPFHPFPSWNVTCSTNTLQDAKQLSLPGVDTSSWYTLNATKGTLMATLIANGVYTESNLFYSTNLQKVNAEQFLVPWYYRSEGRLEKSHHGKHFYTLRTNGITSRADIYLNGHLVANKDTQAGAYVGLEYDVTDFLRFGSSNTLLIKTYPTNYNRDFALGFVDWNPYPPDNGTGVWRDVELKRSGQVSLSAPRVTTSLEGDVGVFVDVRNLAGDMSASGSLECRVKDPKGRMIGVLQSGFELASGGQRKLEVKTKIANPQIWWPKQWGEQPLYSIQCNVSVTGEKSISDSTPPTRFGIRTVTSTLDKKYNDTTFYVNNHPFQVLGAGYTSDTFLRFNESKLLTQFTHVLDMGLNTVRLEGKQEHPRLYELADELGIMLLAGWECCDKWEGWTYNEEGTGEKWTDADYRIANLSMRHEAQMMQSHPSILAFLVGSDYWPDDRATKIYIDALSALDMSVPIISSAAQRGAPALLGNGGMKMDGPYDWVPPNYWFDAQQRLGAAGGFGSELGAGVGTPEMGSLTKFLSVEDLDDLWTKPNKGLYHMSQNTSSFYTREIYNDALWARYGAPVSLSDYVMKAQIMDYEATKAQFEAYVSRWGAGFQRPATGLVYWMLNNAWPSLHWNLFDYYLRPAGAYFGLRSALGREQHVVYDYQDRGVYLVDRRRGVDGAKRTVEVEVVDTRGTVLGKESVRAYSKTNSAQKVSMVKGLGNQTDVVFLKMVLKDEREKVLSRNTYHLAPTLDVMDWENSTWYHTPVTQYSDFRALGTMAKAEVDVKVSGKTVKLWNKSGVPAVFVKLNVVDEKGEDVLPVMWSENYITLWPGEKMDVHVDVKGTGKEAHRIEVSGMNVAPKKFHLD